MTKPSLEQLLRRGDIWRGHSRVFLPQACESSGFASCDKALMNGGWPRSHLLEACLLHEHVAGEWFLFAPLIQHLHTQEPNGFFILLNPPAQPFAPALIQQGLALNQLVIIESQNKQDFLAAFIELTRSAHCQLLLAWQGHFKLSYSELRKCQLACAEGAALYYLLRPAYSRKQSSPAPLRFSLAFSEQTLDIEFFKQRGMFASRSLRLPLTKNWQHTNNRVNKTGIKSSQFSK